MKKMLILIVVLYFGISQMAYAGDNPRVEMITSKGSIVLELYPEKAPLTVANFLKYVEDGYYSGTIFHRVIADFMIQGGGLTADLVQKDVRASVQNEADNGLSNNAGTIAMARTNTPHSATSQFFINVVDNFDLNHVGKNNSRAWGYTVFGRVIEGMDTVNAIRYLKTKPMGGHGNVPLETVIIKKARVIKSRSEGSVELGKAETECYKEVKGLLGNARTESFWQCMKGFGYHR